MKGVFTGIMGIKLVTDPKDALSADADELKPRDAAPILGRTAMLNSPALLILRETISTYSGLNVDVQRELLSRAQGGQTVVELEPATRAAIVATNGDPNSPAHVFLSAPTGSGKSNVIWTSYLMNRQRFFCNNSKNVCQSNGFFEFPHVTVLISLLNPLKLLFQKECMEKLKTPAYELKASTTKQVGELAMTGEPMIVVVSIEALVADNGHTFEVQNLMTDLIKRGAVDTLIIDECDIVERHSSFRPSMTKLHHLLKTHPYTYVKFIMMSATLLPKTVDWLRRLIGASDEPGYSTSEVKQVSLSG